MASLKRDTPAGRAALARRRQRAAAVVENSSRFLNSDDDDGIGTSEDSNNQSPVQDERDQYVHVNVHNPLQSSHLSRNAQPDPPQQQQQQLPPPPPPKGRLKDPPPTATTSSKSASYSAASLPSSDELLERSSQVAQAAASVLASARKNKQPQRTYVYNNNSGASTGGNSTGSDANNNINKFVERLGQERAGTTSIAGSGFGSPSHRQPSSSQVAAAAATASETTLSSFNNKLEQMAMLSSTNQDNPAQILIYQHRQESQMKQPEQQHVQQQKEPSQSTDKSTLPKPKATLASRVGFHSPTLEEYINGNDDTTVQHGTSQAGHSKDDDRNHFHNHQNHLEEEITMEELEPVISRQTEYEVLDAACVVSGSLIMLRSLATSATVTTTIPSQDESSFDSVAFVGGSGLAQDEEIFQLFKVDAHDMHRGSILENVPLRWGDTVAILSPTLLDPTNDYLPKALGIKKRSNPHINAPLNYQIGWFKSTLGQAETWTILRARDSSQHGLRVGLAALRTTKIIQERRAARTEYTRAVHSGDPTVLRNNQTGGILTVFMGDGSLTLVTDSYGHNLRDNSSLLGQLQRHDHYLSNDQDTFAVIKSSVPPCPRWVLAGGTSSSCNQSYNPLGHRIYLHNTYLTFPNRKNASKALQERLFGSQWSSLSMLDDDHERPLEAMNLRDQESLLIDEVIGACLGLEGKHIYVKQLDEGETSDRSNRTQIATSHKIEFALRDESCLIFDANLRNLVDKMLPLAESYVYVSTFVASHLPGYEFGSVMQAFCEALDGLLQEYATFIAELESRFRRPYAESTLTLRRLHSHLMPSLHSMSVLERAALSVRDKIGGALINALSTLKAWSCEGDLVGNKVLSILLDKSSIPYMTMLTTWLQHGLLRDPYREFMIEIKDQNPESHSAASKHSADSDFNNESYLVREEHVLGELMSSDVLLHKVVATGKYWRAVRACKKEAHSESDDETSRKPTAILQYSLSFSSISSYIQSLYESASEALVTLLIVDFNLFAALKNMKQYFLLDQGDFLVHFLDAAEDELLKPLGDLSSGRIQHWLRMSVQMAEDGPTRRRESTSVSDNDLPQRPLSPLKLRCRFEPISLINHVDAMHLEREGKPANNNVTSARDESLLATPSRDAYGMSNKSLTGVETFMLDFNVEFPISLVISPMAMGNYQLLFRLLFFAKYVERRLLGIWQDHQAMKELSSVRGLFGPTYLLRQRMLHFSQNLIYYMMFEVIEPNWMAMENSVMANRRTVDEIVGVHDAFLQRTLEACLLTNRELVRTLTKLMTTCLMFADQMKLFTEATRIHDESSHVAAERRKAIQRSLNDRGGGGSKAPVDKTALREAMNSFKQDRQSRLKKQKRRVGRELGSESYRRMVSRFEEVFTAYLSEFMVQLNSDAGSLYHSHKSNLQARLDYNGFLSSSIVIEKSQLQEPSWN